MSAILISRYIFKNVSSFWGQRNWLLWSTMTVKEIPWVPRWLLEDPHSRSMTLCEWPANPGKKLNSPEWTGSRMNRVAETIGSNLTLSQWIRVDELHLNPQESTCEMSSSLGNLNYCQPWTKQKKEPQRQAIVKESWLRRRFWRWLMTRREWKLKDTWTFTHPYVLLHDLLKRLEKNVASVGFMCHWHMFQFTLVVHSFNQSVIFPKALR